MRRDEFLFDLADWLTDPPSGGPIQMWTVGAGFAALVTGYGMACAMTRHAMTVNLAMRGFHSFGRGLWIEIDGLPAVTFGLLVMWIGLFIHFQWFWGNHRQLVHYHEIPKYAAATGVIATALVHAFTMIARS